MLGQAGRQAGRQAEREVEAGRGRGMQMCSSSSSSNRLVHGLEADGGRGRSQTTKGKTRARAYRLQA